MTNNVMFVSADHGSEFCLLFWRSGLDYFLTVPIHKILILMQNHLGGHRSNLLLQRAAFRFCTEISLCEDVNWNQWKLWIHQKLSDIPMTGTLGRPAFFYLPWIYTFFTLAHDGTTVWFTTSEFNVNTDSCHTQIKPLMGATLSLCL